MTCFTPFRFSDVAHIFRRFDAMAFDVRRSPIAFVVRSAHSKRDFVFNLPSLPDIDFPPTYVTRPAVGRE
jgi:hypothetical protein